MHWLLILSFTLISWNTPSTYSLSVFYSRQDANRVLRLHKRENTLFEELKSGSLERECIEEHCNLEEAKEIFGSREAALNFWTKYHDGDQCLQGSCVNSVCKDGIGKYECICDKGWEGRWCTHEALYSNCTFNNGGCHHFCTETNSSRVCSCAPGYKLDDDYSSCSPSVEYPCGKQKILDFEIKVRLTGAKQGRKGDSPWQAMLLHERKFHCGAALIHPSWVLTAAHCIVHPGKYYVRVGEYDRRKMEDTEKQIQVVKIIGHKQYQSDNANNDIALLRLSEPVVYSKYVLPICLPSLGLAEQYLTINGTETIVTGWGKQDEILRNHSSVLSYIQIPLVHRNECAEVMSHEVSDNMICAGRLGDKQDACRGDSGGPMVTKFKGTWFLVGLVSWGEGCGREYNYGVYTKVSRYLDWINQEMNNYETEIARAAQEKEALRKARKVIKNKK